MELTLTLRHFLDEKGRLISFPAKQKMKLYALLYLAAQFEKGKRYTEEEINDLLDDFTVFHDPATLRRELYNHRFLGREKDGSFYWPEDPQPTAADLGLEN